VRGNALLLVPFAALLLAGCQTLGFTSGGTGEAPAVARARAECPRVGSPADAADLVRFRTPDSRDLTDLVVAARITALNGACTPVNRQQAVEVTLTIGMEAARGAAAQGRSVTLPYFVAVTDGAERVLDKAVYTVVAEFPANAQRVRMRGEEVRLTLPVAPGRSAADYAVYVGFQLSEQELALNRSRVTRR
jgi:hypothetical protein